MTMQHVGYDEDGRIVCVSNNTDPPMVIGKNLTWLQTDSEPSSSSQYVANGQIATRPASIATLTGTTLSTLPQPCDIRINEVTYHCEDGQANLTLPPGEHKVTVSAWPYLDTNFTVRV